jgi:Ca2+-binding RTX toxin-like protein
MLSTKQTALNALENRFSLSLSSILGDEGGVSILPLLPLEINGTKGNDKLRGSFLDDTINGLGGDDNLYGEGGNDTLNGGDGYDYFVGGDGVDTYNGGDGVDTVYFSQESSAVTVDLRKEIAVLKSHFGIRFTETLNSIERVTGTDFADLMIGDDKINTLSGGDGNDTIDGGGGGDRLVGGKDHDVLQGGSGNDTLNGGSGIDFFDGGNGNDTVNFNQEEAGVEVNLVEGKARVLIATLCPPNITLTKSISSGPQDYGKVQGLDFIAPWESCDKLYGFENLISIESASGTRFDDIFIGDDAINTFIGGDGNDTFDGGAGGDRFVGGNGDDVLRGDEGNDILESDAGIDYLDGGSGFDTIDFSSRKSGIFVNLSQSIYTVTDEDGSLASGKIFNAERIVGTAEADAISGDSANNQILGKEGNDILWGDDGGDLLRGGAGQDNLWGGNGNDVLVGGASDDYLSGGSNADRFVFESLDGSRDAILDFAAGEGDRIQISAAGFGGGLTAGVLAADQFVLGSAATDTNDRFLYDASTGVLSFDADGSGSQAAIQIASVGTLSHTDILIV